MKIGFIGLGNMGMGMASNIQKGGHELTVNDLRKEVAKPLLDSGAHWAATPKAVAEASEIVLTSLPGPKEIEEVAMGKDGILEGLAPGGVYIDMSTNSPTLARRIYDRFKEKGKHVMDVPVFEGKNEAKLGTLSMMVGGDEDVYQRCKPVLDLMGGNITYAGKIGNSTICKLVHNCLCMSIQAAAAECFTLGVKAGVDPETLWHAVKDGAAGQGALFHFLMPKVYFPGNFDQSLFALKLALKDVTLATTLGREFNVPMAIANLARGEMVAADNRGWGDKDSLIAMQLQEERAGVEVRIKGIDA